MCGGLFCVQVLEKKGGIYREMKRVIFIVVLMLIALVAAPLVATAVPINYEYHLVNTSAARGVFIPPPGYGAPEYLVATGTPFSSTAQNLAAGLIDQNGSTPEGLVDQIIGTHPLFPSGSPWDPLLEAQGSLDNYTFLTGNLVQTKNGAQQLVDTMNIMLQDLINAYPGVTFSGTPVQQYYDTRGYTLFGDILYDTPLPGEQTIVYGDAVVDFYEVTMTVTASPAPVPEPSTLLLLGSGLAGLAGLRRKWS